MSSFAFYLDLGAKKELRQKSILLQLLLLPELFLIRRLWNETHGMKSGVFEIVGIIELVSVAIVVRALFPTENLLKFAERNFASHVKRHHSDCTDDNGCRCRCKDICPCIAAALVGRGVGDAGSAAAGKGGVGCG